MHIFIVLFPDNQKEIEEDVLDISVLSGSRETSCLATSARDFFFFHNIGPFPLWPGSSRRSKRGKPNKAPNANTECVKHSNSLGGGS